MQRELVNTRQKSGTYVTRSIAVKDQATTAATPQHALAGTRMSGADMVVQVLADEGVDTIFGYSGGAILPTYDAVFRYNDTHKSDDGKAAMPLIVPANEQGAGFMASGYARASGKVGVVLVTSGPGATNTVTPVRDCMADSVPIVVICGQVPTAAIGTDAFQEAPVSAIMGAVAKHIFLVTDADKLEETIRSAFELARTGRPGPVVIDIPKDIQNWEGDYKGQGTLPLAGYHRRLDSVRNNHLTDTACERFYKMLAQAERPLIYAGGGVINGNATKPLRRFANEYGIPGTTTLMALGVGNTQHPLAMHMLGMHGIASANYAVEDCDFLIAVGARFDDRVSRATRSNLPAMQKTSRSSMSTSPKSARSNALTGTRSVYSTGIWTALLEYGRRIEFRKDYSTWHSEIAHLKKEHCLNYDRDSEMIQPYAVIEEINRHTKGEAIISTGVGQHQMWAAQYFDYAEPRLWLTSGSMGTMGFGLPAAIGAQFAKPDRVVVDIDGDASIRMNIGELETATTYNYPSRSSCSTTTATAWCGNGRSCTTTAACQAATSRCTARTSSRLPRPMASNSRASSNVRRTLPRPSRTSWSSAARPSSRSSSTPTRASTRWSARGSATTR